MNIELISSGTVGREFFSCHQIGRNKLCLGAFSQDLWRAFAKLCCCTVTGGRNVLWLHSFLQRAAFPVRQECTVTIEQHIR